MRLWPTARSGGLVIGWADDLQENEVYRFYAGHCALLRQARRVPGCEQFKRMIVYCSLTDKEILRVIALGKTTVHHT